MSSCDQLMIHGSLSSPFGSPFFLNLQSVETALDAKIAVRKRGRVQGGKERKEG